MIQYSHNLLNRGWLWAQSFFEHEKSQGFMERVAQTYMIYLMAYCQSIELNHALDVPVDFQVELLLLNLHIWLLLDRLKQIDNGAFASTIPGYFLASLEMYSNEFLKSFHMGRKTKYIHDTKEYLRTLRDALDRHFRNDLKYAIDPMHRIDALVWSAIFLQKCDRYDNRVYLLSSYLLETWKALQQYDFNDFLDLKIVFNPFVVPADYRRQIEKANPPLSPAAYEADKGLTDSRLQRFHYNYESTALDLPPLDQFRDLKKERQQWYEDRLQRLSRKFHNLPQYDFFSEQEEKEEEAKKKEAKYPWRKEYQEDTLAELTAKYRRTGGGAEASRTAAGN